MKIVKISFTIEKIALRTPFVTALRRVENVEFVRVSVEWDDGRLSFGEAPATKAVTGEDLESISSAIEKNKELFYGLTQSESIDALHKLDIGSSAKACLDMAFYVVSDEGMYSRVKLENEKKRTKSKTAITISLNKKDKMLYDASDAINNSHNILKLKFGSDISHAIDLTKLIAQKLPSATIFVDANQAWSLTDAKTYLNAMKETKIELVEQPLVADDIKGLKELSEYSNIPIVADESCFNFDDVKKVVESKSADVINIKFMKCGGITKAIEILEYCREREIPIMFGSMLEGPLSIGYACFLVDKYADVVKYVDLDSPLLYL